MIGLDVVADPPDAFAAIIRNDTAKWAKVIKDAGIKAGEYADLARSRLSYADSTRIARAVG